MHQEKKEFWRGTKKELGRKLINRFCRDAQNLQNILFFFYDLL
jgi:hypothetical protein